ncbi:YfhO family protein [Paenibacillus shunpengii]|uniref:YfhO family protein n=1 Tax=Paenibacillus shunpengii TaxID=2054424 RepID=A0ABW5SVP3_9BACL
MNRISLSIKKHPIFYSVFLMVLVLLITYVSILSGKLWLKWDVYAAAFPLSVAISDALQHGQLPLWEPFSYRGVPLSHLIGVSIWSPLTILLGFIGYSQYLMQIQYILLILFAALFMYISIFIAFRNPWISMVGGVAYATCGQFVSNAQHLTFLVPMVLFPLLHLSYKKWSLENKYRWSILLGVTIGMLILNNYPPFLFMSVFFILIEYIFDIKTAFGGKKKATIALEHFKHFLVAFIVAFFSGFVSIVTTLEIISQITRGELSWELSTASSLNHWYFTSFLSPVLVQILHASRLDIDLSMNNIYMSLPVILLVFVTFPKKKFEYMMIFLIILSIFTTMGNYGPIYRFYYEFMPSLDSFKFPTGFRYLYFYYLTFYAMYNFNKIINNNNLELTKRLKENTKLALYALTVLISFLVMIYIFKINTVNIPRFTVMELLGTIVILFLFKRLLSVDSKRNLLLICVCIIIFGALGVLRNEEFTIGTSEKPESYDHYIESKYNNYPREIGNSFTDPTPLNVIGHTILTREFQTGGYVGSFELLKFKEAYDQGELPNKGDPVVFAVSEKNISSDIDTPLNIENKDNVLIPEYISYTPNKFEVQMTLDETSYVILEQTIFNGWVASVNNLKTPIQEFEGGVMGIKAEKGVNHITFEFKPTLTIISAWITFLSWIILIVFGLILAFRKFYSYLSKSNKASV